MQQVNQDMLCVARHAAGLTQRDVASRSGLSQGFISKLENGMMNIGEDDLERLAAALEVRPSLLLRQDGVRGLPSSMWAKRVSLPATAQKRLEGLFNLHKMDVARLTKPIEFAGTPIPNCEGVDPILAAQRVRQALRIPSGPIRSITRIVEDAGIPIVRVESVHRYFFGLSVGAEDRHPPIIFINAELPQEKANYYIAHEVMHLTLRHGGGTDVNEMEDDADIGANELMMPEASVRPDLEAQRITMQRLFVLKRKWNVEAQSLLMRALRLGVISESKSTMLWKSFSKRGYRRVEPDPLPEDKPTLLHELFEAHANHLGYSDEDLSRMLGIPADVMVERYQLPREQPKLRLVR